MTMDVDATKTPEVTTNKPPDDTNQPRPSFREKLMSETKSTSFAYELLIFYVTL